MSQHEDGGLKKAIEELVDKITEEARHVQEKHNRRECGCYNQDANDARPCGDEESKEIRDTVETVLKKSGGLLIVCPNDDLKKLTFLGRNFSIARIVSLVTTAIIKFVEAAATGDNRKRIMRRIIQELEGEI